MNLDITPKQYNDIRLYLAAALASMPTNMFDGFQDRLEELYLPYADAMRVHKRPVVKIIDEMFDDVVLPNHLSEAVKLFRASAKRIPRADRDRVADIMLEVCVMFREEHAKIKARLRRRRA